MHRRLQACCLAWLAFFPAAVTASPMVPRVTNLSLVDSLTDGAQIFSQADPATLVSGIDLFIRAGVDRQAPHQGGVAGLTAEMLLDMPIRAEPGAPTLNDAIRARGGSLVADVDGQSLHLYLEAKNADLADEAALVAHVLANPHFDNGVFLQAVTSLRKRVAALRSDPLVTGIAMFRDAYYYNSDAGQPPLGTAADLQKIARADAEAFFQYSYRRGGASATLVGDVSPANKAAAKALLLSLAPGASQPIKVVGRQPLAPQTSIISFRNIPAPWVLLGFPAPTPGSDDFGAMLVLDAILQEVFSRASTTSLPSSQQPIGLQYDFHSDPANVILYVDGSVIDESVALRALTTLRLALGSNKLDSTYIDRYKAIAEGCYLTSLASLPQRAAEIDSLANLGLGVNGLNTVLQKIEAVQPRDVQRVLRRYFDASTASFVLPRVGEQR